MANWKSVIRLGDLHSRCEDGKMTIGELGKELAARVRSNVFYSRYREDLEHLALQLDGVADPDDYNEILEELYEFGDIGHRIWFDPTDGERI